MMPVLVIAFSYLLGSVPFGVVFTRAKGINLRQVGSGNIGATNVLRVAGKGPAALTLFGDVLKGSAAVAIAKMSGLGLFHEGLAAIAVVAGHDFSVFMKFRGGKGVATSIGAILIYSPQAGILTVAAWLITVVISRYSSLGAIASFALLPAFMALSGEPGQKIAFASVLSALLLLKHFENIKRLIHGTEHKVGGKT